MTTAPSSESIPVATKTRILVWDAPVRLSHWLMAGCFIGAYLSSSQEDLRPLHITLGYTLTALVAFRVFWGIIGTRHALFKNFVRRPHVMMRYLRSLLAGKPEEYAGHNPVGALGILALLGMALVVAALGWTANQQGASVWLQEAHEFAANVMLAVVIVHVIGVLAESRLRHENLIGAMFTGRKLGRPGQSIDRSMWLVAFIVIVLLGEFWWLQWMANN